MALSCEQDIAAGRVRIDTSSVKSVVDLYQVLNAPKSSPNLRLRGGFAPAPSGLGVLRPMGRLSAPGLGPIHSGRAALGRLRGGCRPAQIMSASGTTAVLSNGTVLARANLGAETVGETFGPFTLSNQTVYLLLTGARHTFTDANTGFPFAMNAPITVTYVNAQGVTIPMYLYQSTNALYGTYKPEIAS